MAQQRVYEAVGTPKDLAEDILQLPDNRTYQVTVYFTSEPDSTKEEPAASLETAIARMTNRTPEEITAARQSILAGAAPPRELPEGQTLLDTIMSTWPGEETDEQINQALEQLS